MFAAVVAVFTAVTPDGGSRAQTLVVKKKPVSSKKETSEKMRPTKATGRTAIRAGTSARSSGRKAPGKRASAKTVRRVTRRTAATAVRSPATGESSSTAKRRNPRLIQNLLLLSSSDLDKHFEKATPDDIVKLFEQSYPSDLVNVLLGLKRSTCRRLFEVATDHRKKAYVDTITLYFYKDYLTNPFPLELDGQDGSAMPNYYALVGMARDASGEEIDEAWKLLMKAFKPTCFPPTERKMGDIRCKEIKAAFERLRSPSRRQEVNRLLPSINYFYPKRAQSWLGMVQRFSP